MKKFLILVVICISLTTISSTTTSPPTTGATTSLAYTGTAINYTWTTANTNTYMCSTPKSASGFNSNIICAQTEYPKTTGGAAWEQPVVTCPGTSTIKCFLFASYGLVGGRCDGEEFKEDPSNQWSFMPVAVAQKAIGQNKFTFEVAANDMVNGVSSPPKNIARVAEEYRLKVLALCDGTNTATGTSGTSKSGADYFKVGLISLLFVMFMI